MSYLLTICGSSLSNDLGIRSVCTTFAENDISFAVLPDLTDHYAAPESSMGGAEMWKPEHRRAAERRGLRYPSDLTDAEGALVEPMIPPAKRGGRRREVNIREVLNAIFYVLSTGCQWQALPKDLPPKSTAHSYFMLWDWDGTLERVHHALYVATRERECAQFPQVLRPGLACGCAG